MISMRGRKWRCGILGWPGRGGGPVVGVGRYISFSGVTSIVPKLFQLP